MNRRDVRSKYGPTSPNYDVPESLHDVGASAFTRQRYIVQGQNEEYRSRFGMYMGQVKQNVTDPKKPKGSLLVYIPHFNHHPLSEIDNNGNPMVGASVDETDLDVATNWITCYPLFPYAGESVNADGEGSAHGLSYTIQPGTWVAILFAHGDTNAAFWFACAPQVNSRSTGVETPGNDVKDENGFYYPGGTSPEQFKPTTELGENIRDSGLGGDFRGSPPLTDTGHTLAMRSHGSKDRPGVPKVIGHQLIMDDHPAHRCVRLRSSQGAQLLLADKPGRLIYLSTQTGGAWMEMRDDGDIFIHAGRNIAINAKQDITLGAGRDLLIDIKRDFVAAVKENFTLEIGLDYDLSVLGSMYMLAGNNIGMTADDMVQIGAKEIQTVSTGEQKWYATTDFSIGAGANVKIAGGSNTYVQSGAPETPGERPTEERTRS